MVALVPMTEFTDTVIMTYGFVVALVRWQIVTFVTTGPDTVTVRSPVETRAADTVAFTANVNVPIRVGVPASTPPVLKVSPVGSVPDSTRKLEESAVGDVRKV